MITKKACPERSRGGFTLIELLVVLAIMILLTVAAIMGLNFSNKTRQVKSNNDMIKSLILEARSMAMNPQDTDYGLNRIQIRFYPWNSDSVSKQNSIEIYKCPSSDTVDPGCKTSGMLIKTYVLPEGLKIEADHTPPDGNMTCSFNPGVKKDFCYYSYGVSSNIGSLGDTSPSAGSHPSIYIRTGSDVTSDYYRIIVSYPSGAIPQIVGPCNDSNTPVCP